MRFMTFYTPEYADIVSRLLASAGKHNASIYAQSKPSTGSWKGNVLQKLDFLLEVREHFMGPIMFLDADAEFVADPTADLGKFYLKHADTPIAMAWYSLPGQSWTVKHPARNENGRGHAGAIWLNDTGQTFEILERARAIGEGDESQRSATPEEWALCHAIVEAGLEKAFDLPHTLCQIFDKPHDAAAVKIIQHQNSRIMRSKVGKK